MVEPLREAQVSSSYPSTLPSPQPQQGQSSARGFPGHPGAGCSEEERPAEGQVGAEILPALHFPTRHCEQAVPTQDGEEFPVLPKGTILSPCHVHRGGAFV